MTCTWSVVAYVFIFIVLIKAMSSAIITVLIASRRLQYVTMVIIITIINVQTDAQTQCYCSPVMITLLVLVAAMRLCYCSSRLVVRGYGAGCARCRWSA